MRFVLSRFEVSVKCVLSQCEICVSQCEVSVSQREVSVKSV